MNKSRWALVTLLIGLVIILVPARVFASEVCEGDPDPEGGCDQGYPENGQCKCDDVPACTGSCEDRGLCSTGNPGHGVPVSDCSNINGGLGYCYDVDENGNSCGGGGGGGGCDPGEGTACSRTNSCGLVNNGSIQCDGSCSVAPPAESLCGSMPVGVVDPIDSNACIQVDGWAFDPDYSGSLGIDLYRDGPKGVGVLVSSSTANESRPDVDAWALAVGYSPPNRTSSGWSWGIPSALKDGTPHTIYAYTTNVTNAGGPIGPNPVLLPYSNPQSFTCIEPPQGSIMGASCATASGTAIDPQGAPLNIRIYDVQPGVGSALVGTGTANTTFSVPYDKAAGVGGQIHNLTAWAQDISSGNWYQLNGAIVPSCNDAQCISITGVPATITTGGAFTAQVTMKNTGMTPWTTDASPHRLGSADPQDNVYWGTYRVALPGGSVAPGQQATFSVSAIAPAPGTYSFSWRMVEELVEWFGQVCSNPTPVTVIAVPPPTATITAITRPNYCQTGPEGIATWQYSSGTGLAQKQWQMQVSSNPAFSSVTYDSGIRTGTTTTANTGQGVLGFGATYWVRVKVWDTTNTPSAWSPSASFTTPAGPYPRPAISVSPSTPTAKQPVTFTDTFSYAGSPATLRQWNFGDGTTVTETPGTGSTMHTYTNSTTGTTVTLTTSNTNSGAETCSATTTLNVNKPIPVYKEVRPGI